MDLQGGRLLNVSEYSTNSVRAIIISHTNTCSGVAVHCSLAVLYTVTEYTDGY